MYIVFEGGEGSGKGTQIQLLLKTLREMGYVSIWIREPGGTLVGEEIRQILLMRDDLTISGLTEAYLFSASRAQLMEEVVAPALAKGKIVISDRSFFSTIAYQGYARGFSIETLMTLSRIAVGVSMPDLVILLDLDPTVGLARKHVQEELNRLEAEEEEFHQKVRRGYLILAQQDKMRWVIVDAEQPISTIQEQVLEHVLTRLQK